MQERLVLGRDPGRGRDRGYRLHALALGRHEQAGAVVAQGCGAIGVAEDTGQCLDIDAEPRFTTLVEGHRRASCAGPQAFFYDLARPPGARLRDSERISTPQGLISKTRRG